MKSCVLVILVFISTISAFAQNDEFECVRAEPVPILKKSVFPKKTFVLLGGTKDNPGKRGFEKTKVNKDIDLTIKNYGCENYTLEFQFTVKNIRRSPNETKFWYGKAIELMNLVKKGIRSMDVSLVNRGLKALNSYRNKTKNPKFENYIDFGGKDIRDVVALSKVSKKGLEHKVEISFSVGPL